MRTVFHRYGSIVEPDIIEAFKKFDIEVVEDDLEITQKSIDSDTRIRVLSEVVLTNRPDFVFSINYFPYIAQICEKLQIYYLCLSVDCPVSEIYSKTIRSPYNRIFLFDYAQYESIVNENPEGIFYLPLATNVNRWDEELGEFAPESVKYKYDVSLVGSLYEEKSVFRQITDKVDEFSKGYLDGLLAAGARVPGISIFDEVFKNPNKDVAALIKDLERTAPSFFEKYTISDSLIDGKTFAIVQNLLGYELSARDRVLLLNTLAMNSIDTHIFTRSSTDELDTRINIHGGVATHTQMPHVFRNSKINLNPTMRCMQTGLPQRIWDIMGCGGFVMTNIQTELPEYFEVGEDLVCYETLADAVEVAQYYLNHEDERMGIALNGYNKVKQHHTYEIRIAQMLKEVWG